MYKFCKANGGWWFVCKDLENLFEYKDKTDTRYGIALIKGEKEGNKYSKMYQAALKTAERTGCSIAEGMADLSSRTLECQMKYLLERCEIWINEMGGWNTGLKEVEATTYMKNLIFPHCTKDDIRISKFGEMEGGKHYYAHIGEIEVFEYVDGEKIIKWDTYDEAYKHALAYCDELDYEMER